MSSPKISFPNANAFSREHERVKKPHPPTWKAPDLSMPIHQLVDDVQMMNTLYHFVDDWNHSNAVQFESGSWVVARKGRYKGDVGLVVDDN